MTLFQFLWSFIRRHRRNYVLAATMLFCISILTVWIPRQTGHLIDLLASHPADNTQLIKELAYLLLAGIVIYFLRVGWRIQLFTASYQLGVELRTRLYQKLCLQSGAFFDQQKTGDLMAMGTNDADAIELAAGEAALAGFDGSVTFALVISMMLTSVDWRLALVALLPFPFMALAFRKITHHVHDASRASLDSFSALNEQVQESLTGVRTIRALGLEQRNAEQFSALASAARESSYQAQRWEAAFEPAVGLSLTFAGLMTLAVGGWLVWQHEITIGALTSFSMYLGQLIWPMFAAGWVLALLERGKAAWKRLEPVLNAELLVKDTGSLPTMPAPAITLQHVQFAYPTQATPALQDLHLEIRTGQTIGIAGPTGAGKSTLVRLLLRQYELQQGQILWGGHPLHAYQLDALRAQLNWVAQEPFLFSASVAQNIALSAPGASRAQIEEAARLASVHDDILRFPQGYDTPVGERGITLSGGQRQRVAIARALLTDSALLILDDALSAVDTATETQILQHLRHLRQQHPARTMIIISHRLSALAEADQIIVMKNGHIHEQGNHDSLLQHNGWYAAQWRYQQLEASLDAA
ncbi:ABC transporter ATP-binding protein [Undibacterium squillarum]|uniref:ABC transporter ATP-binding protein n=1 Tax=Undibacterium squillarum TaxID=1131567 RepID=UPI0035B2E1EF